MNNICLTCQFCCGVLKVFCYQFCCYCLHKRREGKIEVNILVLGLQNAGKSHLLALLCGESVSEIQSTNGFSIKDITLPNTIIHMKEVGGSDKIKPYWCHYMDNTEGIIFVVDGSDLEIEKLEEIKSTLHDVMSNEQVEHKPLLILVTKVDPDESPYLVEKLALVDLNCSFIVESTLDLQALKVTLQKYADNIALQRYADNLTPGDVRI